MGLISNARINSTCYIFSNASNASSSVMNIKSITLIPGVFISIVTLILAGIILMALKEAKFYSSSVLQLYFNLTVTDAFMAVVGIFLFLQPGDADFGIYQNIAIVTQILRFIMCCFYALNFEIYRFNDFTKGDLLSPGFTTLFYPFLHYAFAFFVYGVVKSVVKMVH